MALSVGNHQTDGNGVQSWDATSVYNGPGTTVLRVKTPTAPLPHQPHRFLYILPVKPIGVQEFAFGDGLEVLRVNNLHNYFHCTLIAPSFHAEPYIGDHPTNTDRRYESFLSLDLRPWVMANLTVTGTEEHWLIGFSKSGVSALVMLFRHHTLFQRAACWDAPLLKTSVAFDLAANSMDWDDIAYGTEANYDANYDLIANLDTYKDPFLTSYRFWLSGDAVTFGGNPTYQADVQAFRDELDTATVRYYYQEHNDPREHTWEGAFSVDDSLWTAGALEGLYQSTHAPAVKPGPSDPLNLAHPLNDGLQIWLLFREGAGSTVTDDGPADLGTAALESGMTWGTHPWTGNPVLLKSGTGNGLDFGTAFSSLDVVDKTIVVWARVDGRNDFQAMVDQDFDNFPSPGYGGYSFLTTASGALEWFAHRLKNLTDTGPIGLYTGFLNDRTGMWRMMAVTWDTSAGQAKFYLEGILNSTVTDATIVEQPTLTANFLIGAERNQTLHPLHGAYDQVRLYDRILSDAEILALFENPFTTEGSYVPARLFTVLPAVPLITGLTLPSTALVTQIVID